MGKVINKTFLIVNIISIFGLLLIQLGSFINPNHFIFLAYPSLFLLPILILNIGFIVFWIVLKKWYFVFSLAYFILFPSLVKSGIAICPNTEEIKNKQKISILSYNTMGMKKMKNHTKNNPNLVLQYILKQDADIVCLQEFAYTQRKGKLTKQKIKKYLFSKYPYRHSTLHKRRRHSIGVITLSKYPIIKRKKVNYPVKFNLSIYSDIVIGKDTLRIINNHLESNRITERDLSEKSTETLSKKLKKAYKVRANQAKKIATVIEKSPYKVICCGDYNDVPMSYVYTKIKGERLKDSFQESGLGLGLTFVKSLYRFRIDYIMHDPAIQSRNFKVGKIKASDHYPIQTELFLSGKNSKK